MSLAALVELVRIAYFLVDGANVVEDIIEAYLTGTEATNTDTDTDGANVSIPDIAEKVLQGEEGETPSPLSKDSGVRTKRKIYLKPANYDVLKAVEQSRRIVWGDCPILAKLPATTLHYYETLPEVKTGTEPDQQALVTYQPLVRWTVKPFYAQRYLPTSPTTMEDDFIYLTAAQDATEIKASDDQEDEDFEEVFIATRSKALVAYKPLFNTPLKEPFYVDRDLLSLTAVEEDHIFLTDIEGAAETKAFDEEDDDFEEIFVASSRYHSVQGRISARRYITRD
ncbi:hypothetical protein EUX98_g3894 [Antrodiella citrinella]|uniref:Uncharacterized protein n=1 Tax=Antrodiella citrinella TaxID=2447956 RepID=A0A4S4MVF4_9APHY|nr:hypothetical protein EUX98_g3894 [Antrodiella citrinella]